MVDYRFDCTVDAFVLSCCTAKKFGVVLICQLLILILFIGPLSLVPTSDDMVVNKLPLVWI